MATAAGDLVIRIMAQTASAEAGFRRTRAHMAGMGASSRVLAFQMAGIAAGSMAAYAALHKLSSAIREVEQFNQGAANSFAIMGDVSEEMRAKILKSSHDVAFATKHSATEVAKAYYYLTSAGLDAAQSLAAMPQVAKFAQAGNFDLARATELATDAQHALGMGSKDAAKNLENLTRITDVLVKANTLADATTEQFAESMAGKAGAAFRLVGKDVEELGSVLAALAQRGIKGEEASTQLSRLMVGLKVNAINNTAAFKKHNIAVYDDNREMRHMADIIRDLEVELSGMSDRTKQATIMELGFTKRTADLAAVLLGASGEILDFNEDLDRAGGITGEVADKQLPELTKGVHQLSVAFTELKVAMLETPMEESGKWMQLLARGMKESGAEGTVADIRKNMMSKVVGQFVNPIRAMGLGPVMDELNFWRDRLMAEGDRRQKKAAAPGVAAAEDAEERIAAARAEMEIQKELAQEQAAAIGIAQEALRQMNMTADERAIDTFSQRLKDAAVPMGEITDLTWEFEKSLRGAHRAAMDLESPLDKIGESGQALLDKWKKEEALAGLEGREREYQEWLNMPGHTSGSDMAEQLRMQMEGWEKGQAGRDKDSMLGRANQDAKDLLATLKQDVKLFGLDPRDRMIADLAEKLGPQSEMVKGLEDWDKKLDELEASTQGEGPRYGGAQQYGTAGAYSAIAAATTGQMKPLNSIEKTNKQIAVSSGLSAAGLESMAEYFGQGNSVGIPP